MHEQLQPNLDDYIYAQVEVFNEDFKYVADILLEQKSDIETKKHLAVQTHSA